MFQLPPLFDISFKELPPSQILIPATQLKFFVNNRIPPSTAVMRQNRIKEQPPSQILIPATQLEFFVQIIHRKSKINLLCWVVQICLLYQVHVRFKRYINFNMKLNLQALILLIWPSTEWLTTRNWKLIWNFILKTFSSIVSKKKKKVFLQKEKLSFAVRQ